MHHLLTSRLYNCIQFGMGSSFPWSNVMRLVVIGLLCNLSGANGAVTTTAGYSRAKTSPELQCYTCTSYMNECKKSVDSESGRVSTTPCHSKCFSRRGEDDAIYRGCFDGFVGVPDLKHDFVGCTSQNWNGRSLMWCFCETDLCNGAYINPADSRPKMLSSASLTQSDHVNKQVGGSHHDSRKYHQTEAATTIEGKGKLNYVIETQQSNTVSAKEASINEDNKPRFKIVNKEFQPVEPQTSLSATISNWDDLKNWEFPGDAKERSDRLVLMNRIREFEPYTVDYNRGPDQLVFLNNRLKDVNHEPQDYREPSRNRYQGWQDGSTEDNIAVFYPSEDNAFWNQNQKQREVKETVYNKPHSGKPVQRVQPKVDFFGKSSQDNSHVGVSAGPEKSGGPEKTPGHLLGASGISAKEMVSQIQCKRSGYYQNQNDCTSFIACLLDPGMQIPVVHVMSCPRGLYWDDGHKICLEYSNTCKDGDAYYKQIYNHSPFNGLSARRDDLVYHKFPEQPTVVDTLENLRVKLQETDNHVTGHRNNFKSISVDLDDHPREQLPEVDENKAGGTVVVNPASPPTATLDNVAVESTAELTKSNDVVVAGDDGSKALASGKTESDEGFDERLNQLPRLSRQGRLGYGRKFYEEVHIP